LIVETQDRTRKACQLLILKTVVYEKANSLLLDPVCSGICGIAVSRLLNNVKREEHGVMSGEG
jgi:hypothetical protein